MARSVSLHTVVLASLGSGSAALLAGQSGLTGTVVGAALVPVVVAAVTERGSRPLHRLARARRRAAGGEGEAPQAAPATRAGGGWERWAAGSAVALAVGALVVAIAGEPAPAQPQVVVREVVQTTRYAEVHVPAPPRTVTVVKRVEVPVPVPVEAEDPAKEDPAAPTGDGATTPETETSPGSTAPQAPAAVEDASGGADPALTDPADATVKEQAPQAV